MLTRALWSTCLVAATLAEWTHSWDTAGAAWWGDFSYDLMNDAQVAFVAKSYAVVSLEKCTGKNNGSTTEAAIYETAARLKAQRSDLKVMFYWSTEQAGIDCYAAGAEFEKHEDWWLRRDNGSLVSPKMMDWTVPAAVDWWVSVPQNLTLIDGILADGAGFKIFNNISESRLEELYTAKLAMVGRLQSRFNVTGGVVFGNGLSEYDLSPLDPHNRRILTVAGGVQNEHYAAFEQIDHTTNKINASKVADALDGIEWAASTGKQVFCSFWAGPYRSVSDGHPVYPDNSQPCADNNCTTAQYNELWKRQLVKYLPFNLASFLTVAQPNTWFTQAVWYRGTEGFFPCPEAPATCMLDPSFYSDYLAQPLGPPKGPRVQVAPYKWTREFEHALVTLDLNAPVEGSSVVFSK